MAGIGDPEEEPSHKTGGIPAEASDPLLETPKKELFHWLGIWTEWMNEPLRVHPTLTQLSLAFMLR